MMKLLANRFTARLGTAGAIASAVLFVCPAFAQSSRLSLADRVARLEQAAQNNDQNGVGAVNRMQQLEAQVRQQQGQIEELQHQLQQLEDKSKSQYVDLDSRLGRIEAGNTSAGPQPAGSASAASAATASPAQAGTTGGDDAAAADPATVQAAYNTAFKALQGGDYAGASRDFRDFIKQYPDQSLTPNAWYWLGESYYATMNYKVSLEAFQHLLSQFPQSEKAPDALLKVGYSQFELKQVDQAKATLTAVTTKYPGSRAANLAKERLQRIQLQTAD